MWKTNVKCWISAEPSVFPGMGTVAVGEISVKFDRKTWPAWVWARSHQVITRLHWISEERNPPLDASSEAMDAAGELPLPALSHKPSWILELWSEIPPVLLLTCDLCRISTLSTERLHITQVSSASLFLEKRFRIREGLEPLTAIHDCCSLISPLVLPHIRTSRQTPLFSLWHVAAMSNRANAQKELKYMDFTT